MSYNYLNDIFGKCWKNRETKYTDVENDALKILVQMYRGEITHDEFFEQFNKVMAEFVRLMDGVFDEDTPLWVNMFGGNVFARWRDWHVLRVTHSKYPEKFNAPEREARFNEIAAMNYDQWLLEKIKYTIDNMSEENVE